MSLHLHSVPLPIDQINNAVTLDNLSRDSRGVDFKIPTLIDDENRMSNILANKLLGFKNKRALQNFTNQGDMTFYYNDTGKIEVLFVGNFDKNESIQFINNLNHEFLSQTNRLYLYQEIPLDIEKIPEVQSKIETIPERKNTIQKQKATPQKQLATPPKVEEVKVKKFKVTSNMKDKDMINSIMKESYLGYNSSEELEKFLSTGKIALHQAENGTYEFIFIGDYDEQEATRYIKTMTEEYAAKVQEVTYEKVIQKLKQKNYTLESEIVDNNDSIVLTVNVD